MTKLLRLTLLIISLAVTAVSAPAMTVDEVPNVHLADRSRYVSDPAGILTPASLSRLDAAIASIWTDTSAEVAVVVVDEIDPSLSPEEFATALFEKWGIGKSDNDNGLLLLVSRDDRTAQIRTGYGLEGVVPDILAGRILRDDMFPHFRQGDFDGGIEAAVATIGTLLRDPQAAAEIASKLRNDASTQGGDDSADAFFHIYITLAAILAAGMTIFIIWTYFTSSRQPDLERYNRLQRLEVVTLCVTAITLGMGAVAMLLLWGLSRHLRRHKRNCPRCGTRMQLIDEEHDNNYLDPAQDLEERLGSVDYDVWRCPKCAQTDILPYVSSTTEYKECPRCHTRAMRLTDRRILHDATTTREGEGVDIYMCRACGNHDERRFTIARKPDTSAVVAGAVIGSALGRRGGGGSFGGGGGFSGGSFGGGHTGGGGAGGSW